MLPVETFPFEEIGVYFEETAQLEEEEVVLIEGSVHFEEFVSLE